MKVNHLRLTNFKCFRDFEIDLHDEFTLLVGNNGSGKSTILDGLAIGLGSFFLGMEGGTAKSIHRDDVRFETFEIGSRLDRQIQYPSRIECKGIVAGKHLGWARSLNSEKGNTTYGDAGKLVEISKKLANQVRKGDANTLLPFLSYYGTGRLWAQKKEKREATQIDLMNRNAGYADCLDARSNDKLMYKWFEQMTFQELQGGEEIPELSAVKKAILQCFNGENGTDTLGKASQCVFNVKTGEIEITHFIPGKAPEVHSLREMSDGYRNMLSMVADIAYRMAVLNPQLLDRVTEETEGVVLIDEIDLHLHPSWQRRIVGDLRRIFPKVQFVATTHAPSVISSVRSESVILLEEYRPITAPFVTYGKDVNTIMQTVMGVPERQDDVKKRIEDFHEALSEGKLEESKTVLGELSNILGDNDPEVISSKVALELEFME